MNQTELLTKLLSLNLTSEIDKEISEFEKTNIDCKWLPFGQRENNRGTIEASGDPGRSLVERLTNGLDALLELEHKKHDGIPECKTPKEAASAWFNIPEGGLSEMTPTQRRAIAHKTTLKLLEGDGKSLRTVEVRDLGIGIEPSQMQKTILSLNESNKISKYYLVGAYGQGGSSTLATSKYVVIASRAKDSEIGFTIAKYQDLPAEQFKTGRYVYFTLSGNVLTASLDETIFPRGTLVKHFGYDLSDYSSPLGASSVYGLLNQTLFDPVLPIWLDAFEVHKYRRVIKGSRNALNGAIDDGDEERKGPNLSHNVKMFYTSIGDFGRIGIEYWVLDKPDSKNKKPIAAFVNYNKPIILTLNGQNQAEFSVNVVRKEAELTFLSSRLIVHVDCNFLSPHAKRSLFVSNREDARKGVVYNIIIQEIVNALRSDDELTRLNNLAKDEGIKNQDETVIKHMRLEVARLLKLQGLDVGIGGIEEKSNKGSGTRFTPSTPRPPRPKPHEITINEPPTYIKILGDDDKPIKFYNDQRKYIRIETDANSIYHNASDPSKSKINIISPVIGINFKGSTPLNGGRMRLIFEGKSDAKVGESGKIRVELVRQGFEILSDEKEFEIIEVPPAKTENRKVTLPPFELVPIDPEGQIWNDLDWPSDPNKIASSAQMSDGKLMVYYSTIFPKYLEQLKYFTNKDQALADSFKSRYEIWLLVHSFILYSDQQKSETSLEAAIDEEIKFEYEKQERCRLANIAVMFAAREVQTLGIKESEEIN